MKAHRKIKTFDTREDLAAGAADIIVQTISNALAKKDRVSIALSGGSTPKALYELLASEKYRGRVDWEKVLIFFGDERCVPPGNDESNYKMVNEALFSRVPIPTGNIFRLKGEVDPVKAAAEYEGLIIDEIGNKPVFDIVLLGLGPDGHTASLFPGSSALEENAKLVTANYVEKFHSYRLTFTFPVINAAQNVIFLVAGEDKAETVKAVFDETAHPALPSQLIQPANGKLLWLLDNDAASSIQ
jgi:6-phosphogluconolactonase